MLKTEAIYAFLLAKTHQDLAALYHHDMEVQVNVARDGGTLIRQGDFKGREWNAFTNNLDTWKPFRIPLNAKSEPHYEDSPLSYSLEQHAEGIGMTGWDWKQRRSLWVAFDFDALVGHSDRHGRKLTDEELRQVQETVSNVPFVTIRRSTSGKGLHLYVMLEPVETANHTEHAALARAILSMLSGITAFDFNSKVDTCGGNMWVWHRKMDSSEGQGLRLLKAGEKLTQIPPNWREHIDVVSHKAKRSMPTFVYDIPTNDPERIFLELTGQRTAITLDCEHRALIDWLANNGCVWWWDQDSHMLVTHTIHLKEAHSQLKLRGHFDTIATGSNRGEDHNCYGFPLRGGAWSFRRYSPGTKEAESWEQDGQNWTRCFFNREPDIHTLARMHEGVESEKGGFVFRHAESVTKVLLALGISCELPNFLMSRSAIVKPLYKDNKVVVHITAEHTDDSTRMKGWLNEKKLWKRVFKANLPHHEAEQQDNFDDLLRHIVSVGASDAGWVLKRETLWIQESLVHTKLALGAMGHDPKEINHISGNCVIKSWQLVNKPFQPEYPGNREWNRNAAQFAIAPTLDLDTLSYPTWTKVLHHCGEGLDSDIVTHEWCKSVGINTGAEFLMLWIATLFRKPDQPSTYLAFWGDQDCGKSIFHEMITNILITRGSVRADASLQSQAGFNYELENAILSIVEETDLKRDKVAYNRIKDWVTSPDILIHPKHGTPYMSKNYTHWVQCSNDQQACPIFPGDTRITLIHVKNLPKTELIPKVELMAMLRKEAPDFLAAILNMELPYSNDRLAVPTLSTDDKRRAEQKNMTMLEQFLMEQVHDVDGHCVSATAFYEAFVGWLEEADRGKWTRQRVGRELPERYPRGRLGSDQHVHYGNMSLTNGVTPGKPYKRFDLFIKKEE